MWARGHEWRRFIWNGFSRIEAGWCTSMLQIFNAKGLAFSEYASILDPTYQELERHSECKANASCLATSIDVSGIKAKHILKGYKCDFIRPHLQEVVNLWHDGEKTSHWLGE
jgi:hypothetical protein